MMSKVTNVLLADECEVCGQEVPPQYLMSWNDREVCKYCIQEITRESERYASNNHN